MLFKKKQAAAWILAAGLFALPLALLAAEPDDTVELSQSAQPLDSAVTELARQSGLIIGGDASLLRGKQAPALNGRYTVEEALQQLLAGSGVEARFDGQGGVTLVRVPVSQGPVQLSAIVVEGERSGRTLEETPASTTVVTGEEADRSSNITLVDALSNAPNVFFDPAGFRLPTIRGIEPTAGAVGGGAITAGAQARVNVIVDDITRPQLVAGAVTSAFGLWDTEQIEIARGPQSTLGGRNSLAGNIRVQTRDPVHFLEGAVRAFAFDERGTVGGALMLNTPVVQDQVALRFTAEVSDGDSFIDYTNPAISNIADDFESVEFERYRSKLLITPASVPDLELSFLAEQNETRAPVDFVADAGTFVNSSSGLVLFFDNRQRIFGPKLKYSLSDNTELEARYSYVDNENEVPRNISNVSGFPFKQDLKTHSTEVLVRAEDVGILNRGVVGLTYDKSDDVGEGGFTGFGSFAFDGELENYSIYAEADIALSEQLALIVGGRLERQTESRLFQFGGSLRQIENDESVFIPKVGLRYDLNDDITLGYQYSEGFRAGGLDFDFIDPAAGFTEFGPETLRQHEVYARTTSMDGRLNLNASAFFWQLDDAQTPGATLVGGFRLRGNIPEIRGYGLEVDGSYDFGNGFIFNAGLGLLETEIKDAGSIVPQFEGDEAPRAPDVTANLGIRYFAKNGFDTSATVRHVGGFTDFLGSNEVPNYTTVDLGAGYEFEIGNEQLVRIDAFVNNVTDERIVTGTFGAQELLGRPRTIGIAASMEF